MLYCIDYALRKATGFPNLLHMHPKVRALCSRYSYHSYLYKFMGYRFEFQLCYMYDLKLPPSAILSFPLWRGLCIRFPHLEWFTRAKRILSGIPEIGSDLKKRLRQEIGGKNRRHFAFTRYCLGKYESILTAVGMYRA